jgi:thymidine kinase
MPMTPIEAYVGPMFSGKSSHLAEDITRREIGKQKQNIDYLVINHSSDTRYGEKVIASHNKKKIKAVPIKSSEDILKLLLNIKEDKNELKPYDIKTEYLNLKALYVDEAQFFDLDLGKILVLIDELYLNHPTRKSPLIIIVAGLDMDFRGEPFGPMPDILSRAEKITKFTAVCTICGENNATRTQRIRNGQPANYHDPVVLVGGNENYTARCPKHHEVPGKPLFKNK